MGLPEVVKGRGFRSQKRLSQFLFNPNQTTINKKIKIAELSRETHIVQMTTQASFFADQENNKHFQESTPAKDVGTTVDKTMIPV
jgi:hypothetical protein